jgi:hypothetical protein
MTKAVVGATTAVVASAPQPQRVKDGVIYWALRIYMRILKAIGDVSELIANDPRKKDQ